MRRKNEENCVNNGTRIDYIDLVVIYENLSQQTEVMYDKNTGVMYFHRDSRYDSFMTPIYNADGTLKLYEEK